MSKERLEEIKSEIERSNNTVVKGNLLGAERMILDLHETGRFEWLVKYALEQAKRVQELEEDKKEMYKLNQKLGAKAWEIEQQNKRYRESIKDALHELYVLNAYENEAVQAAYEILNEALEGGSYE